MKVKNPHPAFGHLLPFRYAKQAKEIIVKRLLPSEGWERVAEDLSSFCKTAEMRALMTEVTLC
jgi:hypothetical protein